MSDYQLPEGYKQTEIGVIPEDWDIQKLGDIARLERGKFSARPRNDPKFFGGAIPFIQTGDVSNSNGRINSYSQTLNEEGLRVSKLFLQNTLFFNIAANIGDLGIASFATACPDSLIAILPKSDIDKAWLYQVLKSRKAEFEGLATQNAQLNINLEKLNPYLLALPPLPEQRSLAQALSDVDALIAALDKLIAKKRDLKTATMQQLLTGKKRLPGFGDGQGYKESAIGLIPEDWDVSAVGDICNFIIPGRNKPKIFKGNIPWVTTPDLEDGRSVFTSKLGLFTSRDEAKIVGSKIVPSGAVIMSCVGELGIVAFVEREIVINQQLHAFIPSPVIDSIFLLNALQAQKDFMFSIATQTAVPYLNKDNCNSIPIPLPSIFEQRAIALVLSDMDNAASLLESRLAKTKAIKQGMMQELLTGRIRFKIEK